MYKPFCSCFPVIKWVMEFLRKHFMALQQMNFSTGVYIMTLEKAKTMYKIKPCGRENNYKEFPPEMMECLQLQSSIFCFNIYLITKGPFSNQSPILKHFILGCEEFHWWRAVTFSKCRERNMQKRSVFALRLTQVNIDWGIFLGAWRIFEVGSLGQLDQNPRSLAWPVWPSG